MEDLRYNRLRQAAVLLLCGTICVVFLGLFLTPSLTADLHGKARILGGDFGHMVVIPIAVLSTAVGVWRSALLLVSGSALEFDDDGLVLTTMTGRHRMAWDDIHTVTMTVQRYGNGNWHRLCIHSEEGNRKLTLGETNLPRSRFDAFVEALQARVQEHRGGAGARAAFNADAVIARYMEKRGGESATASPAPRGFGRKGM